MELVAYLSPVVVSLVMAVELEFSLTGVGSCSRKKSSPFFLTPQLPPAHAVVVAVAIVIVKAEHVTMPRTALAPSTSSPSTKTDSKLQKSTNVLDLTGKSTCGDQLQTDGSVRLALGNGIRYMP